MIPSPFNARFFFLLMAALVLGGCQSPVSASCEPQLRSLVKGFPHRSLRELVGADETSTLLGRTKPDVVAAMEACGFEVVELTSDYAVRIGYGGALTGSKLSWSSPFVHRELRLVVMFDDGIVSEVEAHLFLTGL